MVQIQDTIVSFDVITKEFSCDIGKCHGACCVEGDAGAPVTEEEIEQIENILPLISDMLSADAIKAINDKGIAYPDPEGEMVTQIINGRDCVFALHDDRGGCYCAFEKAYSEGRTTFIKPVSCHLYPIRVKKLGPYWGLNYDRWDICASARINGQRNHVPVYRFLREPLVRRFGEEWYKELEITVEEMKRQNII